VPRIRLDTWASLNINRPTGLDEEGDETEMFGRFHCVAAACLPVVSLCLSLGTSVAHAQGKPNILVIWGDDVGWENVSAYGMGVMGYTTPNLDSIGMEGIRFTDHYAQPSCTAGRDSFITGQYPIRSGMTTVGQPGDALGLMAASPTLAEVLRDAGYATGQFGNNHLGDRNSHLPTVHGFDEFYGNLYHLNT
jgi:arylsulfatase A-like enzyme